MCKVITIQTTKEPFSLLSTSTITKFSSSRSSPVGVDEQDRSNRNGGSVFGHVLLLTSYLLSPMRDSNTQGHLISDGEAAPLVMNKRSSSGDSQLAVDGGDDSICVSLSP